MREESNEVGELLTYDYRVNKLKEALPNNNFEAKRIGKFIVLYHDIVIRSLSTEEQNNYLKAISEIKKIVPDNITMIYTNFDEGSKEKDE